MGGGSGPGGGGGSAQLLYWTPSPHPYPAPHPHPTAAAAAAAASLSSSVARPSKGAAEERLLAGSTRGKLRCWAAAGSVAASSSSSCCLWEVQADPHRAALQEPVQALHILPGGPGKYKCGCCLFYSVRACDVM